MLWSAKGIHRLNTQDISIESRRVTLQPHNYRKDMFNTQKTKRALMPVLKFISGLSLWGGVACMAAFSHHALSQIWIEEYQQAELPLAIVPGVRKKIVLTTQNGLGGQTTAEIVGGSPVAGHYRISSDTDKTISIDIISNQDVSQLNLKKFKVKYRGVTYKTFPAVGLPSPGAGEDLFVGFTVIIKSSASEGELFPSYVIDVVEE
jgi:hypothetical protein